MLATRKTDPYQLVTGMSGLKLGDRFVQLGCAHGGRLGALAAKVGLSGHAAVVVPDESAAERARKGAADAGVFVQVEVTAITQLPFEDGEFELAVVDDTDGLLGTLPTDHHVRVFREALRVVRPGGRVLVVSALPATGLSAILGRGPKTPPLDVEPLMKNAGLTLTRVLGEREGLRFTEGSKPRL